MPINPVGINIGDILYNPNRGSSLNDDFASGVSAITVYSILDFSVSKILLIGELGADNSEIIKTHGATAPTGNTVTLASNTTKAHSKDTKVYVIDYDQIELSHAATVGGSKTVMETVDINPKNMEPVFSDTTYTSGYYFFRFKNSIDTTFSDYSDAIPFTGFEYNTVGYTMTNAMKEMKVQYSETLTSDMMIVWLNEMLRFVRGKLKRWSKYQEFNYVLGQVVYGSNKVAMPTNAYDTNALKAVDQIRIAGKEKMLYIDKREFDARIGTAINTTVLTQPLVGATSLVLTSTADLADDGSIDVYYNNAKYTVEYTTNTRSTSTLSGIPASGDGSITATFAVDSNVWQNGTEAEPTEFTIFDGYIHFTRIPSSTLVGKSYLIDYYTDIPEVDSEGDILVGPRMDMSKSWLKWKIRSVVENNGKVRFDDGDYIMFQEIVKDAKRLETNGQKFKRSIKTNGIFYNGDTNDFDTA